VHSFHKQVVLLVDLYIADYIGIGGSAVTYTGKGLVVVKAQPALDVKTAGCTPPAVIIIPGQGDGCQARIKFALQKVDLG